MSGNSIFCPFDNSDSPRCTPDCRLFLVDFNNYLCPEDGEEVEDCAINHICRHLSSMAHHLAQIADNSFKK